MNEKFVINIGRQLGSGGKAVGERLAERFGIPVYDKRLIKMAAEHSGFGQEFFEKADEKPAKGFFATLLGYLRSPFAGDDAIYNNPLSHDALFKMQSDVIRQLAERESCIFVGRCADYILREHPRCVNIFVSASREDRIERLVRTRRLTPEAAEQLMDSTDEKRADYYNYYSNRTWGAAATYHLCIDSSVLGIDGTAAFAEEFIRKKLNLARNDRTAAFFGFLRAYSRSMRKSSNHIRQEFDPVTAPVPSSDVAIVKVVAPVAPVTRSVWSVYSIYPLASAPVSTGVRFRSVCVCVPSSKVPSPLTVTTTVVPDP